jgi:hypothetical protein
MPVIIGTLLRILAGVGVGELIGKFKPDAVAVPYAGDANRTGKLIGYAAALAVGAVLFSFIAKKFKLKF